jgi:hypothetical protein
MSLVWVVECKICALRFPVLPRQRSSEKSTETLEKDVPPQSFECPHCHEVAEYSAAEFIPGEGRAPSSSAL